MDIESALSQINSMLENEETNEKFKSLVDVLSKSGLGENSTDSEAKPEPSSDESISSLASLLGGLSNTSSEASLPQPKKEKTSSGIGDLSSLLGQASKLFGSSKITNEQRLALLNGIGPFLKKERQAKVNTSKQILKIAGIAKLLDNFDL